MQKNTRNGLIALGLAAFAYWKYKMTPEQKSNLKDKVSQAGKKIMDKVPQDLKNVINQNKGESEPTS